MRIPHLTDESKVKVIQINEVNDIPVKVDGEDLKKILEQGYYVHDERDDDEVSKVYIRAIGDREFQTVSRSGIYDCLIDVGKVEKAIILTDFPNIIPDPRFSMPLALVILVEQKSGDGYKTLLMDRRKVYITGKYTGEAFDEIYEKLSDISGLFSKTRISKDDYYVILHKSPSGDGYSLSSTIPFYICDRHKSDYDYHRILVAPPDEFADFCCCFEKHYSRLEPEFQLPEPETLSRSLIPSGVFEIVLGRVKKSIHFSPGEKTFFVPDTAKYVKANLVIPAKVTQEPAENFYPHWFGDPLKIELLIGARMKPLKVFWKTSEYVEINGKYKNAFDAFVELVEKYNLREEDARKILAISKHKKAAHFYINPPR